MAHDLHFPATLTGVYAYDFGDTAQMTPLIKAHTLGAGFIPPSVHSGGLRYHAMAPLISHLKELKLLEARAVQQTNAFEAGASFFQSEGILPAPEATHAIEGAMVEAQDAASKGEARTILFINICVAMVILICSRGKNGLKVNWKISIIQMHWYKKH